MVPMAIIEMARERIGAGSAQPAKRVTTMPLTPAMTPRTGGHVFANDTTNATNTRIGQKRLRRSRSDERSMTRPFSVASSCELCALAEVPMPNVAIRTNAEVQRRQS